MEHEKEYQQAIAALREWTNVSRKEEYAHTEYKRAWSYYSEAMAKDIGVSVGDVITVTHELDREGKMVAVKRKQRARIISFDVEIIGEDGVPGYPKHMVIARVRFINKDNEVIGRLDDRRINLNSNRITWEKESA